VTAGSVPRITEPGARDLREYDLRDLVDGWPSPCRRDRGPIPCPRGWGGIAAGKRPTSSSGVSWPAVRNARNRSAVSSPRHPARAASGRRPCDRLSGHTQGSASHSWRRRANPCEWGMRTSLRDRRALVARGQAAQRGAGKIAADRYDQRSRQLGAQSSAGGGPEVLREADLPDLEPGAGQVGIEASHAEVGPAGHLLPPRLPRERPATSAGALRSSRAVWSPARSASSARPAVPIDPSSR
jgi:hypothetical protein